MKNLSKELRSGGDAGVDARDVLVEFGRGPDNTFRALDGVDLLAQRGEVTCLLGPNGSGKTTLLNTITGLLRPSAGRVRVLGLDPIGNRREVLRRIALVPQETSLYPELTARENLTFHAGYYGMPSHETVSRIAETLELVQLADRANERAGTFSGGMRRRLALGKALMMRPDVLLLDEPTLGVDVHSREAIWSRVEEVSASGKTVLLTTNYMEEAQRLGDHIVIIDRGANVAAGSLDELTSQVPPAERKPLPSTSLQDVFLHFTGRGLRD